MPLAEKGGEGAQPLSPPQHAVAPERDQHSGILKITSGLPTQELSSQHISNESLTREFRHERSRRYLPTGGFAPQLVGEVQTGRRKAQVEVVGLV